MTTPGQPAPTVQQLDQAVLDTSRALIQARLTGAPAKDIAPLQDAVTRAMRARWGQQ